ncbi:MAG: hypothetical protein COA43_11800 [Robiginitomaculum sp.]|nr:MAG: hypothetical protein COA43_11800 [Robiginitomaculum sp.]
MQGKARFNAYKGLPKGAILLADLERSIGIIAGTPPISFAQTRVPLDDLSGDVDFLISTLTSSLAQTLPHPDIQVRIEGPNGKVLFTNQSPSPLKHGLNTIYLQPTSVY